MNAKLKYSIIALTWIIYFVWMLHSDTYFEPCAHYILGNAATAINMIQLWFYWHTMPITLAIVITLSTYI